MAVRKHAVPGDISGDYRTVGQSRILGLVDFLCAVLKRFVVYRDP